MTTVTFDTLKFVKTPPSAGMPATFAGIGGVMVRLLLG